MNQHFPGLDGVTNFEACLGLLYAHKLRKTDTATQTLWPNWNATKFPPIPSKIDELAGKLPKAQWARLSSPGAIKAVPERETT